MLIFQTPEPLKSKPIFNLSSKPDVVDLVATIAEIAGREGETGIDSTSLAPLLASRTARLSRAAIFTESFIPAGRGASRTVDGDIALRDGRYKLRAGANWMADPCTGDFTYTSYNLYDLAADPFETHDLLHEELDSWASAGYDRLYGVMTTLHQSLIADLCEGAP